MKRSIIFLLFLFAVFSFSTDLVFAQSTAGTPIQGTPVGLEQNPPDIAMPPVKTDVNGKFAYKLPEGKYKLMLSYNDIASKVNRTDKNFASNKDAYEFILTLDEKSMQLLGNCEEKRMHRPFHIHKEFSKSSPQFIVPKGGGSISGTLTYAKVR